MARKLRIEYPGAFYHVTSRGHEKGSIFNADKDRIKFLEYLKESCEKFGARIHCYCLMNNHYHLLIETLYGGLSRIMHKINMGYASYYNRRERREGYLFQGRYNGILIETDVYMRQLSQYIHLNPVRAKIVEKPEKYNWSSYRYYFKEQELPGYLETGLLLSYFSYDREEYRRYAEDGAGKEDINFSEKAWKGLVLGSEQFIKEVEREDNDAEQKERKRKEWETKKRKQSKEIISVVEEQRSVRGKDKKKIAAYLLYKYISLTLKEISRSVYNGKISAAGVSVAITRFEKRITKDKKLSDAVFNMEKLLKM